MQPKRPKTKPRTKRLFLVAAARHSCRGGGDRLAGILVCQVARDHGRRDSLDDA